MTFFQMRHSAFLLQHPHIERFAPIHFLLNRTPVGCDEKFAFMQRANRIAGIGLSSMIRQKRGNQQRTAAELCSKADGYLKCERKIEDSWPCRWRAGI